MHCGSDSDWLCFTGVIKVNEETKREELVYGSTAIRYLVKIVSMLVIVLCMLITAGCAFGAMGLKFRAPRICNEALLETKADLGCADWTIIPKEVGHIGPDGDPEDENSTKVWLVKTTAEYNAECCYDHRLREEAIIWDNLSFWQSQKWVVTSSLINLAVIIVAGLVYEGLWSCGESIGARFPCNIIFMTRGQHLFGFVTSFALLLSQHLRRHEQLRGEVG